jgi:protein phosphatase 1G
LSDDQKPELPKERARIEQAGGSVAQIGPCYRVDGWGLNLSRAFGDFHYKQRLDLEPWEQKVSAEPDVRIVQLNEREDGFFVLGCDGVFELLKNQDIIDFVHQGLEANVPVGALTERLLDQCISPNLMVTQGKGGDNVSAIIVRLRPPAALPAAGEAGAKAGGTSVMTGAAGDSGASGLTKRK